MNWPPGVAKAADGRRDSDKWLQQARLVALTAGLVDRESTPEELRAAATGDSAAAGWILSPLEQRDRLAEHPDSPDHG